MKKKLLIILFITIISMIFSSEGAYFIYFNHSFLPIGKKKIGGLILTDIKDLRLQQKSIEDTTLIGNLDARSKLLYHEIRTTDSIYKFLIELVKNAVDFAGFNIEYKNIDNISPVMEIVIEDFYLYDKNSIYYDFKIRLKINLYSPDKDKLLFTKGFNYNYKAYSQNNFFIDEDFINYILIDFARCFRSEQFINSCNGKMYKDSFDSFDYSNKKLKSIPIDIENQINLKSINFNNNEILKIENLDKLINLGELDLSNNKIKEIENLDNNINLTKLLLGSNNITSIKKLDNLQKINQLDLSYIKISNIKMLDNLKLLQWLNLSGINIKKIEGLNNLENLLYLNLKRNQIVKIENLDNQKNLIWFNISFSKINKIENLDYLENLIYINFEGCYGIKKIENLDKLTNLEYLNLCATSIRKIEGLGNLVNLKKIKLSMNNNLTKIEGLNNLLNLEELDLSYSPIKKLENINNLKKLIKLNISGTEIDELENLDGLENLQELNISESKIFKIKNLEKLPKLNNLIYTVNQVKVISKASYDFIKKKGWKFDNMDIDSWVKKKSIIID